jgi:hypothetical protein
MSNFYDEADRQAKVDRQIKLAITYLENAERLLHAHPPAFTVPPWRYWTLLEHAIQTATTIVEALPEDFFETETIQSILDGQLLQHNLSDEPQRLAQRLIDAIERRRGREKILHRIRQLENVTGRTDEEAELFKAKAAELRAELDRMPQ